jgi:protein SCO1/2
MRRCAEIFVAAAVACGACFALPARADGVPRLDETEALRASQSVIGTVPPDFTLLDRRQRPVRLADYRGKPLLVSFIYTGCFTICPTQTRRLHEAVKGLDRMLGPDQFNVLSIGFNQPFDTPQALRAFAAQHRIDYPNWEFLSPHARHVNALTRAYGFSWVETPAGFDHVVGVTVLDAEGRIHSQVYDDRLSTEALGVLLRGLILGAPPSGSVFSFDELVDRVRILCTVYDPETGEYRYDWALLFEVLGGLAFFTTVGVYLWRERQEQRRVRRGTAAPLANAAH